MNDIASKIHVCHFATSETNNDLYLIALTQERLGVIHTGLKVMHVDPAGQLHFLELGHLLLFPCFLLLLLALETVLAVIHGAADGGSGGGGHHNEVKITGILNHMAKKERTSLKELLNDSVSLPDMIAIFLGVLELIKIRKILICDTENTLLDDNATFIINDNPQDVEKDADGSELFAAHEQIAEQLTMKAENDKGETEA